MPVSLPTAADVRKVREQAAKSAAERAVAARTPLLAVLGAGDAAITAVTKAAARAQTRGKAQAEQVQAYFAGLSQRFTGEEARKAVAELREHAGTTYAGFAERGEKTWGKFREAPQVKDALARFEAYTEKLDARVDALVDDAHDAAEKALAAVTRQTRSTGEKVAQTAEKTADQAAATVSDKSTDATTAISEAGAATARTARRTARRAAERTAPKPAVRPTDETSGS